MKRLSKEQVKRHAQLATDLHEAYREMEAAIGYYNVAVSEAFAKLAPAVEAFNAKVTEANEFIGEVHDEQEAYFDEKSERWQEGDAGSAYSDWKGEWETEVEEVELEEPGELDVPDVDIESFENLEEESSS